jgi:hypothetical protein
LENLVQLIRDNSGFVHADLTIRGNQQNLSIEAPPSVAQKANIISVPTALFVPPERLGLRLEGDDIVIGTPSNELSPAQIALAEHMIAIYNICEKIKQHRSESPLRLFLEAPQVFRQFAYPGQIKAREDAQKGDVWLEAFLHTRVFGLIGDDEKSLPVLMPLIDYLNHHHAANGFNVTEGRMEISRHSPVLGSDECFVSYSTMDAQAALVVYGFLDTSAQSLFSYPLTVQLTGGATLQVNHRTMARPKKVMPAFKNIARFMPIIRPEPQAQRVTLSFLSIPPQIFPRAMRRVLANAIGAIRPHASEEEIRSLVKEAEAAVIVENRRHYKAVKAQLAGATLTPELQKIADCAVAMVNHQLALLDAYTVRMAELDREMLEKDGAPS